MNSDHIKPKYILMKAHQSCQRLKMNLSHSKHKNHSKMNSSGEMNQTQLFEPKKIQQFQSQIQNIIWQISNESKKNWLLKRVVQLMKSQMEQYQQKSKKSVQIQFQEQSKLTKRINYQIDKILQKHNEEIASLVRLKEEINSKRSQRVVFSNLFRKIQTELKNAVSNYHQEIIKSQTSKTNILQRRHSTNVDSTQNTNRTLTIKNQEDSVSDDRVGNFYRHSNFQNCYDPRFAYKKRTKQVGDSRFITQNSDYSNEERRVQRVFEKIRNQIRKYEIQIQKVSLTMNCQCLQEIECLSQNMQSQNKSLEKEVSCIDKQLYLLERQQRSIYEQKKNSLIIQQNCLPKSRMRLRNLKSGKTMSMQGQGYKIKFGQQVKLENQIFIQDMLEIFGMQEDEEEKLVQRVGRLDQKLDILTQYTPHAQYLARNSQLQNSGKEIYQKQAKNERGRQGKGEKFNSSNLCSILQKMEIINQSQKLYEKKQFYESYKRQLLRSINRKETKKR